MNVKEARTDAPILPAIARRWSPVGFDPDRPVADTDLAALLEAARWAPSAYNEQPWRYVLARRSDPAAFDKMVSCLAEGNRAWARHAPVLLLGITMKTLNYNGKPNRAAEHDLGLATANLCVEATARGLHVHPMGGILPDRIRATYHLPDDAVPLTALAIGYLGDGQRLPESVRARDRQPRSRRRVSEFLFEHDWGNPAHLDTGR